MRTLTLAAAMALTAAACGDDSSPDASAETEPSDPAAIETTTTSTAPPSTAPTTTTSEPATDTTLTLTLDGLEPLESPAVYEVWITVDDLPTSLGTVTSTEESVVLTTDSLPTASGVSITIETDDDPGPSKHRVLAGDLVDGRADLVVGHPDALGVDFATAAGRYILATPTDGTGADENERSGVWWTVIPRAPSLTLPPLPEGWVYEGWQVIDGIAVTTGTFTSTFGEPDHAAPFSGPEPGPPLVGEDFLTNAPAGLTFPTDLRGSEIVISVEPSPGTGAQPFPITPLRGVVPDDAEDHTAYTVENTNDSLPTGLAVIS